MQTNKSTINFRKTYFILFGDKCQRHSMNITFSKQTISQLDSVKYLRILIDSKLMWTTHFEILGTKIASGASPTYCQCVFWKL